MSQDIQKTQVIESVKLWFKNKGWKAFPYQIRAWNTYLEGKSGLIHTSTGSGKTYAAWFGPVIESIIEQSDESGDLEKKNNRGGAAEFESIKILWITPLRALATDTLETLSATLPHFGLEWSVQLRTGDTSSSIRSKQAKRLPTALITTPESISLLLSYPNSHERFKSLKAVVVDEWHELIGSKRGVLTELCLARLRTWSPQLKIWGLSATLGNTRTAMHTLLGSDGPMGVLIHDSMRKTIRIDTILPEKIERFPAAGHLGLKLLKDVIREIEKAESCLVFTNTRSQTEIWFQSILEEKPEWAGTMALHHGSLDKKNRKTVEMMLRDGRMKCVICTSSLDLGIDFTPVDKVIQIGSPKGVARLMQRAGRSGHQPGRESRLVCVPSNAFELVEISAAKKAIQEGRIEAREPCSMSIDVLSQHLITVALGGGFEAQPMYQEVLRTHAFKRLDIKTWDWLLNFIISGGSTLKAYPEYSKVVVENNRYIVKDSKLARIHRISIGTITSDSAMLVKFLRGATLGTIEEQFISRLKRGDIFVYAGRILQFISIKDMTVYVRLADKKHGSVPQWMGGRMPLSTELASSVRHELQTAFSDKRPSAEMRAVMPILELQKKWSALPAKNEILIEKLVSREGYHVFIYPFEGFLAHEGIAALLGYRISKIMPITFSIAVNDYGFELMSDQNIPLEKAIESGVFSTESLIEDVLKSINSAEMAKRQFREIARITGLVVQGFPGRKKSMRHLQASSSLFYEVFQRYDPENLFLKQAVRELLDRQLESKRLIHALQRISDSQLRIVSIQNPSPLGFPIMVNRIRANLSSEKSAERVARMQIKLEKKARKSSGSNTKNRLSVSR